jgi:spectinomycin phosphotransferase
MRDRPAGVRDEQVAAILASGWGIEAADLTYAPVGAGSYHWTTRGRWFVTVDDLDTKPWLGGSRDEVFAGLRAAMDTAVALRDAGLEFVAAPVRAADGASALRLDSQYAITVFPHLNGTALGWGSELSAAQRARLADMLATLHRQELPGVPDRPIELQGRAALEEALDDLDEPWSGGPYSEGARALLAANASGIRRELARFDGLAETMASARRVITHGEPHPGNILVTGSGLVLIDWDTVGLAPAERDLWMLPEDNYDPAGLELYRLRWALDDIRAYAADLRAEHGPTAGAEQALGFLRETIQDLVG